MAGRWIRTVTFPPPPHRCQYPISAVGPEDGVLRNAGSVWQCECGQNFAIIKIDSRKTEENVLLGTKFYVSNVEYGLVKTL